MALQLHCVVVRVPDLTDRSRSRMQPALQDLVPWADPYIAELVAKLARSGGRLFESSESDGMLPPREVAEMEPPFPDEVGEPESPPRNWFRRNGWDY